MTLEETKQAIWNSKKIHQNVIDLQLCADKAGVKLPITSIAEAEKLLKSLATKIKRKVETPKWCIQRYEQAHKAWFAKEYPAAFKDGHYLQPTWPDLGTSNGLTGFIIDFLTWSGHFANRTGNEGRVIIKDGKPVRIPSSSKNGMQDIDSNLKHPQHQFGIPWKIEIKVNKDTHKDNQIKYGAKVSSTGGVYSVVRSVEGFFEQLDKLLILQPTQASLM